LADLFVLDEWASTITLLTQLTQDARLDICQTAKVQEFLKGQKCARAGVLADSFCIIFSGQVSLMQPTRRRGKDKCIGTLGRGGFFGEIPLLKNACHDNTVIAIQPTLIFSVDAACFGRTLLPTYGKILLERSEFLKTVQPFRDWESSMLIELARHTHMRSIHSGQSIACTDEQGQNQIVCE
jgi:CRP-like cAMP-binding protein